MQRRHIEADPEQHGLFIVGIVFTSADILRCRGDDVDEEVLVFLVIVGKKPANGIHLLVLVLLQGTEVRIRAVLLCRIVHLGMDLCRVAYYNNAKDSEMV